MADAAWRDVALASPVRERCGLSRDDVVGTWGRYRAAADEAARHLGMDAAGLSAQNAARLYGYYVPVYLWCDRMRTASPSSPVVIGVSAPQGCGKTTLVEALAHLFQSNGVNCVNVSLDDFYLTGEQQDALAAKHPDNSLLRFRGNFGSHDPSLGVATVEALRGAGENTTVRVPRYDKAMRNGRGDRADERLWPEVRGPVDVVLLEGWSLGFSPLGAANAPAGDLAQVDRYLESMPYGNLHALCDAWIVVQIEDPQVVYDWRLQQEVALRKVKGDAECLTDEQVADFVDRFMPAYRAYLPGLYKDGPHMAAGRPTLAFQVDRNRTPV